MFEIRFNFVLPIVAGFLAINSGMKIMNLVSAHTSSGSYVLLASQGLIFLFSIAALITMPLRKHILVTQEAIYIRENLIRNPREVRISDVEEVRWGIQKFGFWTKGRKQLSMKLKNGTELHFLSLTWLPKSKRIDFFNYLRSINVLVIEEESVPN